MITVDQVVVDGLSRQSRDEPIDEQQVEECRKYLKLLPKTKTIRRKDGSSYGLKCCIEHMSAMYITNGAFIKAALLEGFRAVAADQYSAYFNFSGKKLWNNSEALRRKTLGHS